jgi:hypothetical protein
LLELLSTVLSFVFGIVHSFEGGLLDLPATPRLGLVLLLSTLRCM